jgi:hypothetical protein
MRGRERDSFQSPIKYRISYSGHEEEAKAGWYLWNKAEKKQVKISILKFIHLGTRATVNGYDDITKTSYFANIVQNTKHEKLTVKGKDAKGTFNYKTDLFENMRVDLKRLGVKYTSVLYGWMIGSTGKELVEIMISGSALSAWMDLDKRINTEANFIITSSQNVFVPRKDSKAAHHKPVFEEQASDDLELFEDAAKIALEVLEPFLDRLAKLGSSASDDGQDKVEAPAAQSASLPQRQQIPETQSNNPTPTPVIDDDLPF